jgi:hypothetical protein
MPDGVSEPAGRKIPQAAGPEIDPEIDPENGPAIDTAREVLGDLAELQVPLGPMTTYRVGGAADLFVRVARRDDLAVVAEAHRRSGLPLLVVGRGSNLLVSDAGFRGIALTVADLENSFEIDTGTRSVRAGAAVLLPVLSRRIAAAGLTGFEWAVGVRHGRVLDRGHPRRPVGIGGGSGPHRPGGRRRAAVPGQRPAAGHRRARRRAAAARR